VLPPVDDLPIPDTGIPENSVPVFPDPKAEPEIVDSLYRD
jgi:hypothetical protein